VSGNEKIRRNKIYDGDFSINFMGGFDCDVRDMTPTGGAWGGIYQGVSSGIVKRKAYDLTFQSCMAEYGF